MTDDMCLYRFEDEVGSELETKTALKCNKKIFKP